MSAKMNAGMEHLPKDQREWYRLFKIVDGDGSGTISYQELRQMIRRNLKVKTKELPEIKLQARA